MDEEWGIERASQQSRGLLEPMARKDIASKRFSDLLDSQRELEGRVRIQHGVFYTRAPQAKKKTGGQTEPRRKGEREGARLQ